MTYRRKLLLKRFLIVLGILAAVLSVLAIIGFIYLGRYVIYTEEGAYFSFHTQPPQEQPALISQLSPGQVELIMGQSISAEGLGKDETSIPDTEVNGVLVDYETLLAGTSLNALGVDDDNCNTLVLEMRSAGQDLSSNESVRSLIERAKSRGLRLIALISCLDDNEFALAHRDDALKISGDALWMNSEGYYYLDPTKESVINYIAEYIHQLADMGFQEVILDKFSFPLSENIVYNTGDSSRDSLMVDAFEDLVDATVNDCDIGLLITEPDEGHQALESSDRLYVYFSEGSRVKRYVEDHPDQYLVFITTSHDTRFDAYGKLRTESRLDESDNAAQSPDNTTDPDDE